MNKIELNQSDKNVLAEYIYSYKSDILIKSDAIQLVELLYKHNLIDKLRVILLQNAINHQSIGITEELLQLIHINFPKEQLEEIMKEYYGG